MQLRDGETVGDYITRLERRVMELEPQGGLTIQEWHIGQVYGYLLWMDDGVRNNDQAARDKWIARLDMFEERFPEAVGKFKAYMGWDKERAASAEPRV